MPVATLSHLNAKMINQFFFFTCKKSLKITFGMRQADDEVAQESDI